MDEHPNAALTRRVFAAFGKDAKQISAALCREIIWRVPGNTAMSGVAAIRPAERAFGRFMNGGEWRKAKDERRKADAQWRAAETINSAC